MIILDRYEGDFAVLEVDGKIKNTPRSTIENGVPEGSVLKIEQGIYKLDFDETEKRRAEIKKLQDELFN